MSGGYSSSSGSSKFRREGSVNTSSWRELNPQSNSRFNQAFQALTPGATNAMVEPTLSANMSRQWNQTPYSDALCQVVKSNMPWNGFIGQNNLQTMAEKNPNSQEYANNTYDRYANEINKLMSLTRSGPQMTRGGTAAQGFAQADVFNQAQLNREDVISQQRNRDAQISLTAAQSLAGMKNSRDQMALDGMNKGWGAFYNLLNNQTQSAQVAQERNKLFNDLTTAESGMTSVMKGLENNNLSGFGAQTSTGVGGSVNLCCFIFLESYNGELPKSVRQYRDRYAGEFTDVRNGYVKMSKWLVPAMRQFKWVRRMVNGLMVKPLTSYAEWFYGNNKFGWVFEPIRLTWFLIWKFNK